MGLDSYVGGGGWNAPQVGVATYPRPLTVNTVGG